MHDIEIGDLVLSHTRATDARLQGSYSGVGVCGQDLRVVGLGFGVQGSGSRVEGLGFRIVGWGFRGWGSGFRV